MISVSLTDKNNQEILKKSSESFIRLEPKTSKTKYSSREEILSKVSFSNREDLNQGKFILIQRKYKSE